MEQAHSHLHQLQAQARHSMLNVLTPAHRTLLAQVVGQLAIASTPDVASAVKLLDANLSSGEAQAMLSISASLEQQTRQVMESARAQMMKALPSGIPPPGQMGMRSTHPQNDQRRTDPGAVLLHTAMHFAISEPHESKRMGGFAMPGRKNSQ